MERRDALKAMAAGALAPSLAGAAGEKPVPVARMESYIYKTAGACRLKVDVYRGSGGDGPRPVIMTLHGGALITGARYPIPMDLFEPLMDRGFAIVSVDYRLAPETKLPEIIRDVQDAYGWIRAEGPGLFGADPDRIGVQGGSAGGYLGLMTGFCVEPRPKALVSYYGYGDIVGDWYSKPDAFYCAQPAVSREAAYSAVGEGTPCGNPQGRRRFEFYLYCRQQGLWPREVAGFDPDAEPERFRPYCPVQHVTRDYPPTLLAHGDKDTDVPYEQSVLMDAALAQAGVEHEFITLKDAGHGFSQAREEDRRSVLSRSIEFLAHHLG